MKIARFIEDLADDPVIADKMILVAGARQVGKTTTARTWLERAGLGHLYFNWDDEETRRKFRREAAFFESQARAAGHGPRLVFDEIHKMHNWKNLLKGYFDRFGSDFRFMVAGSARLELLQRAGDSMLGQYHLLHLHPLTMAEVVGRKPWPNKAIALTADRLSGKPFSDDALDTMLRFGGFPEPFLKQSERFLNLWHRENTQRLPREDLRDISRITDVNRAEHLMELLPYKVGSPLSTNSLKEDLGCSYDATKSLVAAFEKLYITLTVRPYSKKIKYAISKEPKAYLTDWSAVPDDGPRFENFIAVQLRAFCDYVTDGGWCRLELFYVRDKQGHEVDFLIVHNGVPRMLVETKLSEPSIDKSLSYFSQRLRGLDCVQVVRKPGVFKKTPMGIWAVSANRFLDALWKA